MVHIIVNVRCRIFGFAGDNTIIKTGSKRDGFDNRNIFLVFLKIQVIEQLRGQWVS